MAAKLTEEMAVDLEACKERADGDAAFMAKAQGDIARAQVRRDEHGSCGLPA